MSKFFMAAALFVAMCAISPARGQAPSAHYTTVDQSAFSGNMTIVSQLKDGSKILSGVEVAVFAGAECRAAQVSDDQGFVFLTVPGDKAVKLTFSVFVDGKEVASLAPLDYMSDLMVGNMSDPYVVNIDPSSPCGVTNPQSIVVPGAGNSASGGSGSGNGGNGGFVPGSTAEPEVFQPANPGAFSGNMTLVALVKDLDQVVAGAEVGVFAGKECRGAAVTDASGFAFVTIAGGPQEALTISVHTASLDTAGIKAFDFVEDAIKGTPSSPYVIQLGASLPDVDPEDGTIPVGDVSGMPASMKLFAVVRDGAEVVAGADVAIFDGEIYRVVGVTDAFGHVMLTVPGVASEELWVCVRTESRGMVTFLSKFTFSADGALGSSSAPYSIQLDPSYTEENALRSPRMRRLSVWPNPAVDYVVVTTPSVDRLVIASESGATVLSQTVTSGETRIDVSSLPAGLYAVRLGDSAAVLLKK